MNFQPLRENEIVRLWSTAVMKQLLPGAELANTQLAEIAESKAITELDSYSGEAIRWLLLQIEHGIKRFSERTGLNGIGGIRISARFELHGLGGYRSLGNEPGSLLSGRYGVRLPLDIEPGPGRDDLHPGYISFYDPRSAMNMNAINRDPYLHYHRSISLKPGLLLMWPSYLSFFIHPNLSRTTRVSVAFSIYKEGGAV